MNRTHRALVCRALSDDFSGLAVETLATPEPGPAEVLVRMRAASVNFPDLLMTQGRYQFRPELPFVPGIEGAVYRARRPLADLLPDLVAPQDLPDHENLPPPRP